MGPREPESPWWVSMETDISGFGADVQWIMDNVANRSAFRKKFTSLGAIVDIVD